MLARTVEKISCASTLRGSAESVCSHDFFAKIQPVAMANPNAVPKTTMRVRGGNDFLSGMLGGSSTLTVAISFASWTLASSYSFVKVSKTASCTLVVRYRSAYFTPSRGSLRIDGYRESCCCPEDPGVDVYRTTRSEEHT